MGYPVQRATTDQCLYFMLYLSGTITGATGKSPTVKLSKNGATGVSPSGTVSQVDATNHPGLYKVAPNASDNDTFGPLRLTATAAACDQTDEEYSVVAYNPLLALNLGLTNLDAAISTRSTYAGGDTSGTTTLLSRITAAPPTAGAIADAVFDELLSGHVISGSAGAYLAAAGAGGDPLATVLPGAYEGNEAGYILWLLLSSGRINLRSPIIDSNGAFTIDQGDDYDDSDTSSLVYNLPSAVPDLTDATVVMLIKMFSGAALSVAGSLEGEGTENQTVTFEIPKATTGQLTATSYQYKIVATLSNGIIRTLQRGTIKVIPAIT